MVLELHGFPGAGKTTCLTMIAQYALAGKSILGIPPYDTVFTSFACPGCYQLDFNDLGKYDFRSCLIIIDEISMYADNRNFKQFSDSLLYFFKMHRHYDISLVWCSQSASDADKKIRTVTELSCIIEPWGNFTIIKPIDKKHTIINGAPDETFMLAPPAYWVICYRPRWYSYFDSYVKKDLPIKSYPLWQCNTLPLYQRPKLYQVALTKIGTLIKVLFSKFNFNFNFRKKR